MAANQDRIQVNEAWRDELEIEMEQLKDQINEAQQRLVQKKRDLDNLNDLLEGLGAAKRPVAVTSTKPGGHERSSSVADAAVRVLTGCNEPIYYKELAKMVMAEGTTIRGIDPQANLITQLVRDKRFARTGSGTYGLFDWNTEGQIQMGQVKKENSRSKTKTRKTRKTR